MKVLVVGSGGREHALVHALRLSPSVTEIHALPGNVGMMIEALCHSVDWKDQESLGRLLEIHRYDVAVVGPEVPLAGGLADFLREKEVSVFGPSGQAAQLEASKVFAKNFMKSAGVPTASFFEVSSTQDVMKRAESFQPPYVLKVDGLAAGKGVFIAASEVELKKAAEQVFDQKVFGDAGARALLEEFQPGWELSFHILTNGKDYVPLPLTQDHKRLKEGDEGPNTGGMGVVGPILLDSGLEARIHEEVLKPTVAELSRQGLDYRGVLYVGLMITEEGPKVLEYNVRFGDPETQVLMPLLDGDWGQAFQAVALGELPQLAWKKTSAACVVLAADGYPEAPRKGVLIEGDPSAHTPSSYFLHAGTSKNEQGQWVTSGGRVLNAVGLGPDLKDALRACYVQADKAHWPNRQMRRDIGQKVLKESLDL